MRRWPKIYDEHTRKWVAEELLKHRKNAAMFRRRHARGVTPDEIYERMLEQEWVEAAYLPWVMARYFQFLMVQEGATFFEVVAYRNPEMGGDVVRRRMFYGPEAKFQAQDQWKAWVDNPRFDAVYIYRCQYKQGQPGELQEREVSRKHEGENLRQMEQAYADGYDTLLESEEGEREYGVCETCGGEWGDGWSNCTCYEDEEGDLETALSECGMMGDGYCLNAGTEYCDWECPFRNERWMDEEE